VIARFESATSWGRNSASSLSWRTRAAPPQPRHGRRRPRRRADGYTILFVSSSLRRQSESYAKVPCDPDKDFIRSPGRAAHAASGPSEHSGEVVQELVDLIKATPEDLSPRLVSARRRRCRSSCSSRPSGSAIWWWSRSRRRPRHPVHRRRTHAQKNSSSGAARHRARARRQAQGARVTARKRSSALPMFRPSTSSASRAEAETMQASWCRPARPRRSRRCSSARSPRSSRRPTSRPKMLAIASNRGITSKALCRLHQGRKIAKWKKVIADAKIARSSRTSQRITRRWGRDSAARAPRRHSRLWSMSTTNSGRRVATGVAAGTIRIAGPGGVNIARRW